MAVATEQFTGVFNSDPTHSSFEFGVKHMKVANFRSRFSDVSAQLRGDETGLRLVGNAKVESISIHNPPEFRAHVVGGADFFDGDNHPEINFSSTGIDLSDDGTFTLEGELTIKGVSKPITATGDYQEPIEDPYGFTRTALELHATVDRRDWGMDWQAPLPKGGDVLGYDVELSVHLELIKQA